MLNYYEAAPNCQLARSGAQSIPTGVTTVVTFDTETRDLFGMHHASVNTGRITIPTGLEGYYIFGCSGTWASNATGRRLMEIQRNGTAIFSNDGIATSSFSPRGEVTGGYPLAAGDYIEIYVHQSSGGDLNFTPSFFWAARISR